LEIFEIINLATSVWVRGCGKCPPELGYGAPGEVMIGGLTFVR